MNEQKKITSFTDLITWQEGHAMVLSIYKLTKSFPAREQFGLTSQMQRAAVSVTSNIAEGFSRTTRKEKARFYYIALGSLTELQNQLLIARDIGYCTEGAFVACAERATQTHRLLNGLIRSASSRSAHA